MADEDKSAEAAAEHVEDAKKEVSQAEEAAPTTAIEDALKSVQEALGEIKSSLAEFVGASTKKAEETSTEATTEAQKTESSGPPEVHVEKPPTTVRHVRRNGRKVKRES